MELPTDIIRKIISYNNTKLDVILKNTYKKVYDKTPTYNNINQNYYLCMFNYQVLPVNKQIFYSNLSFLKKQTKKYTFVYNKLTAQQRRINNSNIYKELIKYDIVRCVNNYKKTKFYYMVYLGGDFVISYNDFINKQISRENVFNNRYCNYLERVIDTDLKMFFQYNDCKPYNDCVIYMEQLYKNNKYISSQKIRVAEQKKNDEIQRKIDYEIFRKADEEYKERQKALKKEYDERMKKANEFQKQTLIRIFGTDDQRNLYPITRTRNIL